MQAAEAVPHNIYLIQACLERYGYGTPRETTKREARGEKKHRPWRAGSRETGDGQAEQIDKTGLLKTHIAQLITLSTREAHMTTGCLALPAAVDCSKDAELADSIV